MKHQKSIPAKIVLHIYNQTNTHLNTAISQLIAGVFFSACGRAINQQLLKGRTNAHAYFRKGGIFVYRKRRELSYDSGILNLADKVSPKFSTQKNGVKNATVKQWRTAITICPVRIWA